MLSWRRDRSRSRATNADSREPDDSPPNIQTPGPDPCAHLRRRRRDVVLQRHRSQSGACHVDREALIRSVDTDLTPTSFVANLLFDPEMLEPREAVTLEEDMIRIVNLTAGSGRIKAVGAAPNGLGTETLLMVRMKVLKPGYAGTFAVDVQELVVIEDFEDIASQVWTISGAVSQQTEIH